MAETLTDEELDQLIALGMMEPADDQVLVGSTGAKSGLLQPYGGLPAGVSDQMIPDDELERSSVLTRRFNIGTNVTADDIAGYREAAKEHFDAPDPEFEQAQKMADRMRAMEMVRSVPLVGGFLEYLAERDPEIEAEIEAEDAAAAEKALQDKYGESGMGFMRDDPELGLVLERRDSITGEPRVIPQSDEGLEKQEMQQRIEDVKERTALPLYGLMASDETLGVPEGTVDIPGAMMSTAQGALVGVALDPSPLSYVADVASAGLYKLAGDDEAAEEVLRWSLYGLGAGAAAGSALVAARNMRLRKGMVDQFVGAGKTVDEAQKMADDLFIQANKLQKETEKAKKAQKATKKGDAEALVETGVDPIHVAESGEWSSGLIEAASEMPRKIGIDNFLRFDDEANIFRGAFTKASGVSPAEIRATGLNDHLQALKAQGRTDVTRDEIVEYLKNNQIDFKRVVRGAPSGPDGVKYEELNDARKAAFNEWMDSFGELERDDVWRGLGIDRAELEHGTLGNPFFPLMSFDQIRSTGLGSHLEELNVDPLMSTERLKSLGLDVVEERVLLTKLEKEAGFLSTGPNYKDGVYTSGTAKFEDKISESLKRLDLEYEQSGGMAARRQYAAQLEQWFATHDPNLRSILEVENNLRRQGNTFEADLAREKYAKHLKDIKASVIAHYLDDAVARQFDAAALNSIRNSSAEKIIGKKWNENLSSRKMAYEATLQTAKSRFANFERNIRYGGGQKNQQLLDADFEELRNLVLGSTRLNQLDRMRSAMRNADDYVQDRKKIYEVVFNDESAEFRRARNMFRKFSKNIEITPTTYGGYALIANDPTYREVLMVLKNKHQRIVDDKSINEARSLSQEEFDKVRPDFVKKYGEDFPTKPGWELQDYQTDALDQLFTRYNHWGDTPNTMMHLRMTDQYVTGPDGKRKKILLIQEVQSDWHQKAREYGYKPATPEKASELLSRGESLQRQIDDHKSSLNYYSEHGELPEAEQRRLLDEFGIEGDVQQRMYLNENLDALTEELAEIKASYGSIPDAPFKRTNEWAQIGTREAIRIAATQGYDGVAFIGGMQANKTSHMPIKKKMPGDEGRMRSGPYKGSPAQVHYDVVIPKAVKKITGQKMVQMDLMDKNGNLLSDVAEGSGPRFIKESPSKGIFFTDELRESMSQPQRLFGRQPKR